MSSTPAPPEVAKRRWYALAQRHRRMAELLHRAGHHDGAVFHAYHAHECAISAFLIARGFDVPAHHGRRLAMFSEIMDIGRPYASAYRQLRLFTVRVRNESLYYDAQEDRLPNERFDAAYVDHLMPLVHALVRSIWQDIR